MTLPRMSHSRYEQFARCGEEYRLRRIERVPVTPSIYAIRGVAFHEWTDHFDTTPFPEQSHEDWLVHRFKELVTEAEEKSGFALEEWDNPRRSRELNVKEYDKFCNELGPDMIQKYIEWRANSGWFIPDLGGEPGIELELKYRLGDVEGVAKIDRVFHRAEENDLVAIDTKTWSRKRVTAQLPTYLVALRQNGINVVGAGYYEARKGTTTDILSYKYWNEKRLAALHQQAAHMISEGWFLPAPGEQCRTCDVRRFCTFALD